MTRIAAVVAALVLIAATASAADSVNLPCTADTSICSHPSEQEHNHGGKKQLRVKGNEHILLMKFDLAPLQGRAVRAAKLMFHPAGEVRLRVMGISTVMADWAEGTSSGPAKKGEATFLMAAHGERAWKRPGSTFLSVVFGGLSAERYELHPSPYETVEKQLPSQAWYKTIREEPNGWMSVAVAPEAVAALVQGTSYGLAFSDEKGQTRWNNDLSSREQAGQAPYLLAYPTDERLEPVKKVTAVNMFQYRPSSEKKDLIGPRRKAPPGTGWVEAAGLRYRILPLWAQMNPVGGEPHFGGLSGWVFDGTTVRLEAPRNGFACVQVAVEPGDAKDLLHTVVPGELTGPGGAKLAGWSRAHPVWFIKGGDAAGARHWLPDPLLPENVAGSDVGTPPGGTRVTLLEFYAGHQAVPGVYRGFVKILRPATAAIRISLELSVHRAVLPDELGFKVSLNTYGSPGGKHGRQYPSMEFLAEELTWHRMAHEHRATIAAVPYSQSGQVPAGEAPAVQAADDGNVTVTWEEYDRRWGPYFTGQAFQGLPRDGVPLDHVYLPMHENWPLAVEKHYQWAGDFETHWKRAGPIAEGFDAAYPRAFAAVSREFARHVAAAGWTRTQFQCYLNNKYSFKQEGRGSSYWLLDEPMHRDDYLALAFFGGLFKAGLKEAGGPGNVIFRVDLSRPEWDRGDLSPVTDLCVCNAWRQWPAETFGRGRYRAVWSYGTTPGPDAALTEVWRWLVAAYAAGCDGMVPWQTIGRQDSWTGCEATSVLYPSRPGMSPEGPVASLRLKALREAQQDIELVRLLCAAEGRDPQDGSTRRERLAKATDRGMAQVGNLAGAPAVTVDLGHLTADEIIDLRHRLLEALDK